MLPPALLRAWPALALAVVAALAPAAPASAHSASANGGAGAADLDVTSLKCGTGNKTSCPRGQKLRLSGEGLAGTRSVTFLGRRGKRDDRTARPTQRSSHRVLVAVPTTARTGPVKVVAAGAATKGPRLRVLPAAKPESSSPAPASSTPPPASGEPAADGGVFPVRGPHDYGTEVNRFGGGRNHRGQDVLADCGTPLVAALPGVVTYNTSQSAAGNYVVVKGDNGTDQAYMHLIRPASVKVGQRVAAGQEIGNVGQTGRASACHLHFELWTGGWYRDGGEPIDPLPTLQRWDAAG